MKKLELHIQTSINKETGEVASVYFKVRKGKVAETREFARGNAFADYDKDGNLLGIELLGPCDIHVLDKIAKKESPATIKFLHNSIPRQMAIA